MSQAETMRPSGPLSDRKDIQGASDQRSTASGIMTLHEKLQIGVKAIELEKQGKLELYCETETGVITGISSYTTPC